MQLYVLIVIIAVSALLGSAAGAYLLARFFDPDARGRRAFLFEQAKNQIAHKDPFVRAVGALALGDLAAKEVSFRGLVLKVFGEFLQRHAGALPVTDDHGEGSTSPVAGLAVRVDIQAVLESLGTLNRISNKIDVQNLALEDLNLAGANLKKADLQGACLSGCIFRRADFSQANLRGTNLKGCQLQGAKLLRTNASAQLLHQNKARLRPQFANFRVFFVILEYLATIATFLAAFFSVFLGFLIIFRPVLVLINWLVGSISDLIGSIRLRKLADEGLVKRTNLAGADLRYADLSYARFLSADLRGADFTGANCRWAAFNGALLHGANLKGAVNLLQAQVDSALIDTETTLPDYIRRKGIKRMEKALQEAREVRMEIKQELAEEARDLVKEQTKSEAAE